MVIMMRKVMMNIMILTMMMVMRIMMMRGTVGSVPCVTYGWDPPAESLVPPRESTPKTQDA